MAVTGIASAQKLGEGTDLGPCLHAEIVARSSGWKSYLPMFSLLIPVFSLLIAGQSHY